MAERLRRVLRQPVSRSCATHYISNQAEHHQAEAFQDEFRRLCRKYGLDIDERYVWD